MERVYFGRNVDAHFIRGLLEAAGIAAEVRGEDLSSARGEIPLTDDTLPSVWVLDDSQVDQAYEIVAQYDSGQVPADDGGQPWQCPKCGEMLESQFTVCWQCGTEKLIS